jgi:inhibitor of cysteine peptidase
MLGIAVLVVGVLTLAGCGQSSEVVLNDGDSGSQVTLQLSQTLIVRLEGNPSTGFSWEVAEVDEAVLRQVGEINFEAESDVPGSPGIQVLRLEPVASGETTLELVYWRPWEPEDPIETFSVRVIVP